MLREYFFVNMVCLSMQKINLLIIPVLIRIQLIQQFLMLSLVFFLTILSSVLSRQTQLSTVFQAPTKTAILPYHSIELHGNFSLGYYYATIFLGTPAQKQSFIIDTGSTIFAIPCNMCTSCGLRHMNPKFDVTRSNTSRMVTCEEGFCRCDPKQKNSSCRFNVNYAQGSSLNGVMVQDVIVFQNLQKGQDKESKKSKEKDSQKQQKSSSDQKQGNIKQSQTDQQAPELHHQLTIDESVRAIFGCITQETHLFLSQKADGILGLGPIQISNVLEQIKIQHSPTSQQELSFSICYADNGGLFTIGGLDPNLKINNSVVVKYRQNNGRYSLGIDDIFVGSKPLNLTTLQIFSGEGIVVDSGATFTYFQREHYKTIVAEIDSICKQLGCEPYAGEDSKCYHFPTELHEVEISFQEQLKKFPSIDIKHGIQKLQWSPLNYFLVRNEIKREACLGFLQFRAWILGGTWMLGRDVNFNLDKKTVTISDSTCSHDPDYIPPKFHKMYANDRSPLTDLFMQIPQNVLIGVVIVLLLIALVTAVVILLRTMRKQTLKRRILQTGMQSIQMIEEQQSQLGTEEAQ